MSPRRPSEDDVPAHVNGADDAAHNLAPADPRPDPLPTPAMSPIAPDAAPPAEQATPLRTIAHYAGLVLASMVGTLFRLGLEALGTCALLSEEEPANAADDGAIVFPLAWVQGVGCGIMGLALARKNQISWLWVWCWR